MIVGSEHETAAGTTARHWKTFAAQRLSSTSGLERTRDGASCLYLSLSGPPPLSFCVSRACNRTPTMP